MNTNGFVRYAGVPIALAICSACSGSLPASVSTGQGNAAFVPPTAALDGLVRTAAHAKSKAFEYITYENAVGIFDYPKSDKQIGTINASGGGSCTNVLYGYGNKTFWIVAGENAIEEYAVPKRPIRTLSESFGAPSGCAMNASGDLAVGMFGSGTGGVVIFKHARGPGKLYAAPLSEEYFIGYDNEGNLFADGFTSNPSAVTLMELPKGSRQFQTVTTSNTVQFPGSVQWDGSYLTVFDQLANAFYRYTINGTTATLKGTVSLSGAGDCAGTWIVRGLVYCADAGNNVAEIFKYPAGGAAIATLASDSYVPLGVVAAKK